MGMRGKVQGKSKEECWAEVVKATREASKVYMMSLNYPPNKEEAFEQMKKDEETGLWVLSVHFDN